MNLRFVIAPFAAMLAIAAPGPGLLCTPEALACGGFFVPRVAEGNRRPSLAYEQTLIVFDDGARREHFVREVVFRTTHEHFGFVVPTPSRPDVGKLASPFATLRSEFPFEYPPLPPRSTHSSGMAKAAAVGGGGGGVQVLSVSKVGSFTAFVLSASDARALTGWLSSNGLVSTPEADVWLAHYVSLGFFYVAMRYDPPAEDAGAPGATVAETVRISFDSPLPFYPYLEPDPPGGEAPTDPRMLDVWLVSTRRFLPVAARTEPGQASGHVQWVKPLATGRTFGNVDPLSFPKDLTAGDADGGLPLLPAHAPLVVQRFADQKRSRVGFGDVVFVPVAAADSDADRRGELARFLAVIDPTLAKGAP